MSPNSPRIHSRSSSAKRVSATYYENSPHHSHQCWGGLKKPRKRPKPPDCSSSPSIRADDDRERLPGGDGDPGTVERDVAHRDGRRGARQEGGAEHRRLPARDDVRALETVDGPHEASDLGGYCPQINRGGWHAVYLFLFWHVKGKAVIRRPVAKMIVM